MISKGSFFCYIKKSLEIINNKEDRKEIYYRKNVNEGGGGGGIASMENKEKESSSCFTFNQEEAEEDQRKKLKKIYIGGGEIIAPMEDLSRILFNGKREDKIQAAIDVCKLKMINQRNMLVDSGIIIPLVSMIRSQDNNVIEAALSALISLAMGSERNKIRIAKSGTIPVLVGLLIDGRSGLLIELALVALLKLSSCITNKSAIAASGVVPVLVEFLRREEEVDDIRYDLYQAKLDVIDILHSLSISHRVVFSIVSAGTVFPLLQLIANSDKSSKVVEKAVALLETIVSSSEIGLEQTGGAEGGILALVETIEDGSQQSKEHAVEVLFHLCKSCREKYRELILKEGAIPGLLQLCVNGTWRSKDKAQALLFLLRETSDSDGSSKRQLRNRFLEQIMNGIDSDEEKVAEKAMRMVEKMIMAV